MARKSSKRSNHKKTMTIPVAVVAGFAVPVVRTVQSVSKNGIEFGARHALAAFTGWDMNDNKFYFSNLNYGLVPVLAGTAIHKLASVLGVNRALASAGIPLLRI